MSIFSSSIYKEIPAKTDTISSELAGEFFVVHWGMKYQTLANEACRGFKVYIAIKQKNQNLINVYLLASFVPFLP